MEVGEGGEERREGSMAVGDEGRGAEVVEGGLEEGEGDKRRRGERRFGYDFTRRMKKRILIPGGNRLVDALLARECRCAMRRLRSITMITVSIRRRDQGVIQLTKTSSQQRVTSSKVDQLSKFLRSSGELQRSYRTSLRWQSRESGNHSRE